MDVYLSMLDYDESFLLTSTLFLICHKNEIFLNELKKREYLHPLIYQYLKNLKLEDIIDNSNINFTNLCDLIKYEVKSTTPFLMEGLTRFLKKENLCYYCRSSLKIEDDIFISTCRSNHHATKTNSIFHKKCAREMLYLCFECEGQEKVTDCTDNLRGRFCSIYL